jgi:hypothetical protein
MGADRVESPVQESVWTQLHRVSLHFHFLPCGEADANDDAVAATLYSAGVLYVLPSDQGETYQGFTLLRLIFEVL